MKLENISGQELYFPRARFTAPAKGVFECPEDKAKVLLNNKNIKKAEKTTKEEK